MMMPTLPTLPTATEAAAVLANARTMAQWMGDVATLIAAAGGGGGATSPLTTKGDVWGYDTVDDRIPVGSNNQVLTADSAQALGLKWATPASSTAPVAYHAIGAGWTHACTSGGDQSFGADAVTMSCAVPAAGNLVVWAYALGAVTWRPSPPDTKALVYFDAGLVVDGSAGGADTMFVQDYANTLANVDRDQSMFGATVVACPAAATRVVKVNFTINADVAALAHYNAAQLATGAMLQALWTPGTPISDGGDFTP